MICTNCQKTITNYPEVVDNGWINNHGIACSEYCYEGMTRYLSVKTANEGARDLAAEIIKTELRRRE